MADAPDPSVAINGVAAALNAINATLEKIAAKQAETHEVIVLIAEHTASIAADHKKIEATQKEMLERASSEALGIYMRPVTTPDRFGNAIRVHALKESGRLDGVMAEMSNPTPIG